MWTSRGTHLSQGFAVGLWGSGRQFIHGFALSSSSVMFSTPVGGHHVLQGWDCPGPAMGSFTELILQKGVKCFDSFWRVRFGRGGRGERRLESKTGLKTEGRWLGINESPYLAYLKPGCLSKFRLPCLTGRCGVQSTSRNVV